MKAYGGVDVESHILLTSALAGVSGQLHAKAALSPGKEPPVPMGWNKRLGGPHNRIGRSGELLLEKTTKVTILGH
jgi:hypothetical protein